MPGLLVTATDTGVGKTQVACALVAAARALGRNVGGMKPFESGCGRDEGGRLVPADARLLRDAGGGNDPIEMVCPYALEAPLAPALAAAQAGVDVDLDVVERAYGVLSTAHPGGVVVEGAGGLLVPLDAGFTTFADLALRLSLPVVVVARPGLGTVNHTALTVEALATRGLECRGVIVNDATGATDPSVEGNVRAIERLADVPVLATLPHLPGVPDAERIANLARLLVRALSSGGKMDLPRLLS